MRGRVATGAADVAPDWLADGESDARAEAAPDDEDEHCAEGPGAGVVDGQVIEHGPRRSRPEQDSDQQAHVLGEREPEPAPVSVRESDDRRDQDQDVDEVDQPALPRNTLPACSGRTLSLGDRVDPCFFSSANGFPRGWG